MGTVVSPRKALASRSVAHGTNLLAHMGWLWATSHFRVCFYFLYSDTGGWVWVFERDHFSSGGSFPPTNVQLSIDEDRIVYIVKAWKPKGNLFLGPPSRKFIPFPITFSELLRVTSYWLPPLLFLSFYCIFFFFFFFKSMVEVLEDMVL